MELTIKDAAERVVTAPGMPTAEAYELADARARIEGLERLIAVSGSRLARPGIATGAHGAARGRTRPAAPGGCAT
jgi:hypothetical protein